MHTERVGGAVNAALVRGARGFSGGISLARLLAQHRLRTEREKSAKPAKRKGKKINRDG
jgi:hypothetical protein